jgi:hypothetical protein
MPGEPIVLTPEQYQALYGTTPEATYTPDIPHLFSSPAAEERFYAANPPAATPTVAPAPIRMTRAEYEAMYGESVEAAQQRVAAESAPIRMTRAEYFAKFGETPEETQQWNLTGSVKNLLGGAVEGTLGTVGMIVDLNPLQSGGPKFDFPTSKAIAETIKPYMPAEDPNYRYARTIGQFVGPGGAMGAAGKALKVAGKAGPLVEALIGQAKVLPMAESVLGGVGSKAAEDLSGEHSFSPLVGALTAASLPRAARSLKSFGRGVFRASTPAEIKAAAAHTQNEMSGLTRRDLIMAIRKRPKDALGRMMSTAEVTDSAGMAQIEKMVTGEGPGANLLKSRTDTREGIRNDIIRRMSQADEVHPEGLGSELVAKAETVQKSLGEVAEQLWRRVPRHWPVNVSGGRGRINALLKRRQAGLAADSRVRTLANQFIDAENGPMRTSGALQDIRSDALALTREANLTPYENEILGKLRVEIDAAMDTGLQGKDLKVWEAARKMTATEKSMFAKNTAGGSILNEQARASNVLENALKGDARSVRELRAAIGNDPALMEKVKRAFIDSIGRTADDKLTVLKTKKFIGQNRGAIRELLGDDHYKQLVRILEDLRSERRPGAIAFLSSSGNSVTSQRQTIAAAFQNALASSVSPGRGVIANAIEEIKKGVGLKDAQAVRDLLIRAAFDPRFALDLSKTPTVNRIVGLTEQLKRAGKDILVGSGKALGLELSSRHGEIPILEVLSKPRPSMQGGVPIRRADPASTQRPSSPAPQSSAQSTPSARELSTRQDLESSSQTNSRPSESNPGTSAGLSVGRSQSRGEQLLDRSSLNSTAGSAPDQPSRYTRQQIKEIVSKRPPIVRAMAKVESSLNPYRPSAKGAKGLMQIMPEHYERLGITDPTDPVQSLDGGTQILKEEAERYRNVPLALAAYNLGSPKLDKAIERAGSRDWAKVRQFVPLETREYVTKVLGEYRKETQV